MIAAGGNAVDRKYLFILNDAPYGSERVYNGLRLAASLVKGEGVTVRIFLLGDAVLCGLSGQVTPNGYYNIERMLAAAVRRGAEVGACGTCMEARGVHDKPLVQGVRRSSLEELTQWTLWADHVMVF